MNRLDGDNINMMSTISSIRLLDSIAQSIWDRMTAKRLQHNAQGASTLRLHAYAKKWISWAQSGVRVETLWLKLKTTLILQNICGETLLLE